MSFSHATSFDTLMSYQVPAEILMTGLYFFRCNELAW